MLILTAKEVRQALTMDKAIDGMKTAFAALASGNAEVPIRTQLPIDRHNAISLFMPALVDDDHHPSLAVKIVSVFPNNPKRDLPLIHAAVVVLEADSGRPVALLEGGALTAIRTGAASGAASDEMARQDSKIAAIFGAGVQGCTQLEAICHIRPIQTVWVYDPNPEQVQTLIDQMAGREPVPEDIRAASNPKQAVEHADIICTATTSTMPVFNDRDLKPGVHINAVGAYTPEMVEAPADTVARSLVVVDERTASLAEAGDLIQAIHSGQIGEDHIHAELGEIILEEKTGRMSASQITFFKSVGNAVQDAVAARLALQYAKEMGLGTSVDW